MPEQAGRLCLGTAEISEHEVCDDSTDDNDECEGDQIGVEGCEVEIPVSQKLRAVHVGMSRIALVLVDSSDRVTPSHDRSIP